MGLLKKVKLVFSYSGLEFSHLAGEIVELEKHVADAMLSDGRAVPVEGGAEVDSTNDSNSDSIGAGADNAGGSKSTPKS